MLDFFSLASLFSFVNKIIIDRIIKPLKINSEYIPLISVFLGIAMVLIFNIDFVALTYSLTPTIGGKIISGILIGGGANLIHDVWPQKQTLE